MRTETDRNHFSSKRTPEWTPLKVNRGLSSTARRHVAKTHKREYEITRRVLGCPALRSAASSTVQCHNKEPFTEEGFMSRLIRWIVVDDQVGFLLVPPVSLLTGRAF